MPTARVPPQLAIVTLGVADLDRSARFYRDLGWEQRGDQGQGITWFRTSGTWLGLFGHAELAKDAGVQALAPEELPVFRGITLAVNLGSRVEVDEAFEHVARVGGRVVKAATVTDWGGYSGYFADPDGHLWELAHNPGFPIDDRGRIEIPG
ncbi:MAG TPA: VOC family protein [Nocardioidaceae bacterium]|nr:VOC family protein [Nocardioidaceae bacterium]